MQKKKKRKKKNRIIFNPPRVSDLCTPQNTAQAVSGGRNPRKVSRVVSRNTVVINVACVTNTAKETRDENGNFKISGFLCGSGLRWSLYPAEC